MSKPPKYVQNTLDTLTGAGFEALPVGGCVRDILLGRRPLDWDVASSALPEEVIALFPRTVAASAKHGTVTVMCGKRGVEVTSFRAEGLYSDHRRPDSVSFTGDLLSDLSRRDFTVNAMALSASGDIIDPFGGRADLTARLIRCVGIPEARFTEDALRMLRAFRFRARLGFELEEKTRAAIFACAPFCAALSPERVRDELLKTLASPRPETVLEMLYAGLLNAFLTSACTAQLPPLRLAALPKYARTAHFCAWAENCGLIMSTESFLSALRLDGRSIKTAAAAVGILRSGSRDWKRLLRDCGEAAVLAAYPKNPALRRVLKNGECRSLAELAVTGGDMLALGYVGRDIGLALDRLLEHVIDFPRDNDREILCKLAEKERT
ncbi:MAG: hypothetical protein RR055_02920 [Oscillospiraceae bacterium]